jgi:oxaloacetate decarboxylase alpha subunit
MKMELEVKAPCDGTITFTVQPGSQVTAGQNIASIGGTVSAPVAAPATPAPAASAPVAAAPVSGGTPVTAPVAGTLLKHSVASGASVKKGDTVIILESMKMELEVKAPCDGTITFAVQPGTQVTVGMALASVSAAASAPVASASAAVAAAPTGGKPVNAPVAGTLLKYAVSEGDSVTADTTIMYVESMKMELEIKAGAAGKVHFIAATGTQITSGQVIAEIK